LEANAVLLQQGGRRVVFVQVDVLSVGNDARTRILERLSGKVQDHELFLVASHTHFAPNIDSHIPILGILDQNYIAWVIDRIVDLLERLLSAKPQPVFMLYGEGLAAHSIHRRHWCWKPVWGIPPIRRVMALHPNPKGKKDETVRMFVLSRDAEGRMCEAVLWNYTCHPVTTYPSNAMSADYPGVVREGIRNHAAADAPVVFLPGFSGDTRPNRIDRLPRSAFRLLHRIVNGPVFGDFTAKSSSQWNSSLAEIPLQVMDGPLQLCEVGSISCRRQSHYLAHFMERVNDDRRLSFHLVRLSDKLVILGVSAESVIEYVERLRLLFPGQMVICVGYIDGVYGYLPTSEMLQEGGLAVTSPGYGLELARYHADITEKVLDVIRHMSQAGETADQTR
jgi:hypothetical protein